MILEIHWQRFFAMPERAVITAQVGGKTASCTVDVADRNTWVEQGGDTYYIGEDLSLIHISTRRRQKRPSISPLRHSQKLRQRPQGTPRRGA